MYILIGNLCIYMYGREQRVKPIIIDPGLYQDKKTDIYWMTQRRAVPTKFRLFTGKFAHYACFPILNINFRMNPGMALPLLGIGVFCTHIVDSMPYY